MKDLRKDEKFHKSLTSSIEKFHDLMRKNGYVLKVSQLTLEPYSEDEVCRCGTESYQDPESGEWKTRCRRCTPNRIKLAGKFLRIKNIKLKKKKGG
jgi:hypothetical protein